ncbi:hypothetical protein H5410_049648 [Solanum commersonii]|uniref:Uncharacterized protein n=1 Tax=Solanum commersonii TaxID=4109 RepID=A0A9J5WUT0_SOLCO|nr:hypothetical protein H5410_049648 [Solanum commersonii]
MILAPTWNVIDDSISFLNVSNIFVKSCHKSLLDSPVSYSFKYSRPLFHPCFCLTNYHWLQWWIFYIPDLRIVELTGS